MVSLVKLIDGTEVMGLIKESNERELIINNPLKITYYAKTPISPPAVALQRYLQFSSVEDLKFKTEHILNIVPVKLSAENYYKSALESIQLSVDPEIEKGLIESSSSEDIEKEEAYKALLEKFSSKATLN